MGSHTDAAQNKPIYGASNVPAGPHTLRIDNWGPDVAMATYRVRLIPR